MLKQEEICLICNSPAQIIKDDCCSGCIIENNGEQN